MKLSCEESLVSLTKGGSPSLPDDTEILYSQCHGTKSAEIKEQITLDDAFRGFSCTKLITTISVLQCVEKKMIGLDDEVETIMPELKDPEIILPDSSTSFRLERAKNKITVRHLLTHTSGISYDAMHPLLVAWRQSRGEQPLVMSGRTIEAFSLPVLFEPGTSWVYGASLDWAGVLVERLSNMKLATYMEEHVFRPLGLTNTTLHITERPDMRKLLAQMFLRTEEGKLAPIPSPYPEDAQESSGGMGLITTTSDFVKVLTDLLKDNPVLLKAESVTEMFTPQFHQGTSQYEGLIKQEALHKQLTGDDTGSPGVAFGLGGMVIKEDTPNLPAKCLTWNGMPNIGWFVNRESGLGAVYVSQLLPAGDSKSAKLLGEFWRQVWVDHLAGR
ncbi:beta-lactamase family protein [Colletotrichum scovillei]|uniref:Beta-lactamase family protein n=2 Tax=Colletotrichum scovillei TaxID=1209932 RepID=A0A9P7U6V3_9PEZI|nr:beta-lactamase family protein [Colletotrichum scovillei]KAG7049181.1 beta-lactamase family protein [Colletotrichum scovillei]KAG7063923.1 beta-lactamase family protein [Colletotrichum scovillei]